MVVFVMCGHLAFSVFSEYFLECCPKAADP